MAKLDWDNTMIVNVLDRPIQRLEAVGVFVEGAAKLLCPVDTGNLRDSINHKVESVGLDANVKIGTNVEYAPYVEFGTGEFAANGQGRKGGWFYKDPEGKGHFTLGNHPQPYLRPALLDNKDTIINILTNK